MHMLIADLQDPPGLILEMVRIWLSGSKYVVCARKDREDPVANKLFAWCYYRLVRLFVMKQYPAGGYDLALMDRALLPYMRTRARTSIRSSFSYWLGFAPTMIYYNRLRRQYGKSRWSFAKRLTLFLDSLWASPSCRFA